jgi:hypothetical protein
MLSVSTHVGLGFALGAVRGPTKAGGLPQHPLSPTMIVILSVPSSTSSSPNAPQVVVPDDNKSGRVPTAIPAPSQSQDSSGETSIIPIYPSEPHYFLANELTEKPLVLQDIPPTLNLSLRGAAVQPVVLRLLINEQGDIDRVEIDESELPEEAEKLVIQAFSKIKFYPGKLDASFVKSQLRIEVILDNTPPFPPLSLER